MRIIDFPSSKVAALLFVNSQIGAFALAKISCCNKLAAMSLQRYISLVFFVFAIRIGSYVYGKL